MEKATIVIISNNIRLHEQFSEKNFNLIFRLSRLNVGEL